MRRFTSILLILLFLPLSAMAQISQDKAAQLLSLMGFENTFDEMRESVAGMVDDGSIPAGTALASVWPVATTQFFYSDIMYADFTKRVAGLLSDDDADILLEVFNTEFALKITALEEEGQQETTFEAAIEQGSEIVRALAPDDPERLQQYREMTEVVGTLDAVVRTVMNMQYALLSGASLTGMLEVPLSNEQISERLKSVEPQVRQSIRESIIAASAFIYRELSDDELDRYITLLEMEEVSRLYGYIGQVSDTVMSREFARFVLKLAEIAPQSEL